jgi:hypothetical protein
MQMIAGMMIQMRPGYEDKTPERIEMRRKRLHSKAASEFLGEWQGEPCGLMNGRVRAYTEIGDLDEFEETNSEKRREGKD